MPHFIILSYGFGDFYSFIIISQCLHTNAQCSSLKIQKSFFGALQSVDLHVFDSTFLHQILTFQGVDVEAVIVGQATLSVPVENQPRQCLGLI